MKPKKDVSTCHSGRKACNSHRQKKAKKKKKEEEEEGEEEEKIRRGAV